MGTVKIMSASAGSGKTYTLAYQYVRNIISNPSLYAHILAVTFTNKATEEMKRRILEAVNELANDGDAGGYRNKLNKDLGFDNGKITARAAEVRSKILHDYSRFSVLTIDKFFQRIIRSFLKELGITVNFNLELTVETLLGSATDRLLNETSSDTGLRSRVSAIISDRIDDNKAWNVKSEIERLGRQLFTEAYKTVAAAGKTTKDLDALVKQIYREAAKAKGDISTAAEKLLGFIVSHGLDPDDFPYKKSGVGGYIAKAAAGVLEPYGSRVTDALEGKWATDKSPKKGSIEPLATELTLMLKDLCAAYDRGISVINTAALVKENYGKFMLMGDLRRKVEEISREEDILHITEVNDILSRLVSGNDAPFIFEKTGTHFSHFMIDEFQDTSSMQWNNFVPLLKNAVSQSEEETVLLVGDVKQSIYRWRGGDWSILSGKAKKEFPETISESLRDNYRSRAEVVRFMNAIIGECVSEDSRIIDSSLSEATAKGSISAETEKTLSGAVSDAYSDYLQTIPESRNGGFATVTYYDATADKEYIPPVIATIEELQKRGYTARDIAVLVRRNAEGSFIAQMLLNHKKENPGSPYRYDVITQDALIIGKSPVVNFLTSCMKLIINPDDQLAAAQYNLWMKYDFGRQLNTAEKEFFGKMKLMPPEEVFEAMVLRYGLSERSDEISYLQAFHQQLISFSAKNITDIPLFMKWWEETGRYESVSLPANINAITIDTIHRSKGLGYRAVIIPYCNWSMNTKPLSTVWAEPNTGSAAVGLVKFPLGYKKDMAMSDFSEDFYREYVMSHIDNLNLFYVAVTRAKEELHIMIPAKEERGKRETIDRLISASLRTKGAEVSLGNMRGQIFETGENRVYSFGSPTLVKAAGVGPEETLDTGFPTAPIYGRVKLKLSRQRYFDEGSTDLAPRDYGILMHKAFENAATIQDISANVLLMEKDGIITPEESLKLSKNLNRAMGDETIKSWFEDEWEEVRNESGIIVPGKGNYRPDRVMIKGKRAVVVDYKFGVAEDVRYLAQTERYMSLLRRMGFDDVSGYLWYINLGKTVKV